jgi:hypothetical protein
MAGRSHSAEYGDNAAAIDDVNFVVYLKIGNVVGDWQFDTYDKARKEYVNIREVLAESSK